MPKGAWACLLVKNEEVAAALGMLQPRFASYAGDERRTCSRSEDAYSHIGLICLAKHQKSSMHCDIVYEQKRCMMRSAWVAFRTKQGI